MIAVAVLLILLLLYQRRRETDPKVSGKISWLIGLAILIYVSIQLLYISRPHRNLRLSGATPTTNDDDRDMEDILPVGDTSNNKDTHHTVDKSQEYGASEVSLSDIADDNETRPVDLSLERQIKELQICRGQPDSRAARIPEEVMNNSLTKKVTFDEAEKLNQHILPGGWWRPDDCQPQSTVAILIPFRDRWKQLPMFLRHMHPFLQRQKLQYRIFVVEQYGMGIFNKGKIFNAGFIEISKLLAFDCFILHDVDMLPEDNRIWYGCHDDGPEHLSVGVNEFQYRLLYDELVGGALKMNRQDYKKVNGYSNLYWGWGAEDDDMAVRIKEAGMTVQRKLSSRVARYSMIKHKKRGRTKKNHDLLSFAAARVESDGVNNVEYDIEFIKAKPLYTHIMVNVGSVPPYSYLRKLIESFASTSVTPQPVLANTLPLGGIQTKEVVYKQLNSKQSVNVIGRKKPILTAKEVAQKKKVTVKVLSKKDRGVHAIFKSYKQKKGWN